MTWIIRTARGFSRDEMGASIVEYAVLLILIAVICLGAMTAFGSRINDFFNSFATTI